MFTSNLAAFGIKLCLSEVRAETKMLSWVQDVYRRHKKKIITLGVVAGGAYAAYKVATWKFSQWRELELEE